MLKTDVKTMSDSLDECLSDIADIDLDYLYCSAEQLLSEDIWKKFECDVPVADLDDIFSALDASAPDCFSDSSSDDLCEIRNHDCMWAGHCGSKEHPADELKKLLPQSTLVGIIPPAGVQPKTPAVKQQPIASGRSVLLKPIVKTPAVAPVLPSPDSPPISDDEDPSQTSTLKMLNDAIDECDIEEDSDLCEYFGEGEDMAEEPEPDVKVEDPPPKPTFAVESDHSYHDHSYHKDKNASMRITNLGIDTPSDSEEEIDVVSITEKQNMCISRTSFLPTNPSSRDKQHLQRKVASAITGKHITTKHGLKMIPPVRKCTNMSKKRLAESPRGIKRTKQHYLTSPYKRRNVAQQQPNSSDSEPELEKRSLHNNMERQRRIDLRNSFEDLRMLVPEVSSRERAAKVVILREAALYCDHLGDASESMQRKVVELRRRQEYLRSRVSQLRKNLAAKR